MWEYKCDDFEIDDLPYYAFCEYLCMQGHENWELVNIIHRNRGNKEYNLFLWKRVRPCHLNPEYHGDFI